MAHNILKSGVSLSYIDMGFKNDVCIMLLLVETDTAVRVCKIHVVLENSIDYLEIDKVMVKASFRNKSIFMSKFQIIYGLRHEETLNII
jgi:hypothetical protein